MVNAGWYPDPSDQSQQRYWDGVQWTEHVETPPAAGVQERPPITYGQNVATAGTLPVDTSTANPIGPDFGQWASATFGGFVKGFLPALGLILMYSIPFWLILYFLADLIFGDLVLREDLFGDPTVDGFGGVESLYGIGAFLLIGFLLQYAGVLSAHHYFYRLHMRIERSFLGSFLAGLKGLPKYLLFGFAIGIVSIIVFGSAAGILIVTDGHPLVIAAVVILGIALFFALVYVAIRLVHVSVTATVAPQGEGFVRAAWNASKGRFWMTLGRVLLVYFVASAVSTIGQLILQVVVAATLPIETTDSGELLLNGSEPDLVEGIVFSDFLPSPGAIIFTLIFYCLIQAGVSALYASNTAAMYVQDQDAMKLRRD